MSENPQHPAYRRVARDAVRLSVCAGLAVGALGAAWLSAVGTAENALRLAAWSLAGGVVTAVLVWANARRFGVGDAVARIGLPNALTIVRFALIAPTVCLLVERRFVDAAVAYGLLIATDVVDGVVARTRRQTSRFGAFMDPLADVASTFAIFTVFVVDNLIPLWLYVLLAVRYAMLGLGSLVLTRVAGPIEFQSTLPGKVVGVVQAAGAAWIMVAAAGRPLAPGVSGVLFAFLGLGFASIVVSQTVIGYRHVRRAAPRARG